MKKLLASVAVCAVALTMTSCAAGPHQLKRSVDDWDHQMYVKSPWINAACWVVPVFPICNFVAGIGDFFVVDAYAFWFHDAWDMKGTGFKHADVPATDGAMGSLLGDGSFLKVDGK